MAHSSTVAFLLIMSAIVSLSASESHFETYTYYVTESRLNCVTKSAQSCRRILGIKISCNTVYSTQCDPVYETALRAGTRCQTGWSSTGCDIPICNQPCVGGKVCTAPDKCECVTTGDACLSVPCSADMNCYPGSCISATCSCPPGFSGTNCLTINKAPDITTCQVQLYDAATALAKEVDCEAPGIEPQTTTWISVKTLSKVIVKWTSNYVQPFSLPDSNYAPHVQNSPVPIGVSETGFSVSFQGTSANVYTGCSVASPSNPAGTVNCEVPRDWVNFGVTPVHNQTFRVDVSSKLGGHKDGANSPDIRFSNFAPQYFTGTPSSRSALFKFDLAPPVHCLSNPNSDCPVFAIYLEEDITTNPTIDAKIYNWMDDGSGISKYHIEVYSMQPNPQNLLVNSGIPLFQADISPNLNNFVYVCTASGVYSIELSVEDQAGNTAKARKLFIFNKDSKLTTNPNKPVYIKEADPDSSYKWITKFDNPQNGGNIPLTLVWTGHFSSSSQFDSSWGLPAQPWNIAGGIDDSYHLKYGRRSIDAVGNMPGGIVSYGVAYIVDPKGGGKGFVPDNWTNISAAQETYSLPISSLADGNTIVVWLQGADAIGDLMEKLVVGVDRTPPEVKDASFSPNGVDESTSRMFIQVSDISSGIQQISFGIYDSKLKKQVYSGKSGPQKRDPSSIQSHRRKRVALPCTLNDTSCYCTPSGDCYNYIQTVDIDNCWLEDLSGHTFVFRFTVTNGANLTSSEQTETLGELTLQCRNINECDSVTNNCTLNENMTCQNTLGSYKCHSDDGWKSEVTDQSVIGISVGAVVGGIAIIIAVLFLVRYAMKRMKNQQEIESEEVSKVCKESTKAKLADLNTQERYCSNTTSCSTQVKKDLPNETAKTDSNYEDLTTATRTNQVYEAIRKPSESNGDAEADSRGTAAGPSTSANVKKGIGGIFKSPRNKDLKIGKATRDSIYPELGPSAEAQMENVYETIKKVPEISIDISAQGKISKYSSYT